VRGELAAAARAREAAGFGLEASDGLASIERGLAAYIEKVAAQEQDPD
jgi:hypothetical protein